MIFVADISSQINTITTSKEGHEIKQAIWEALYILEQAGPSHIRGYNIDSAQDVVWGISNPIAIGFAEEVSV